ncbi:POZ [Glarea lozoyensis ATCC 20868]|uniref:POZ n=1 Tax=Glarea lozoyensis (strain ATCC 20868 / MF5171) TaxID=1116229 RepID=S3DDM2_GLAL2|nr:POZ [Glarea lozoyensis ATCC 20868]EPE24748.1 POZ [Glarea lozoyensis ATCC 20868]
MEKPVSDIIKGDSVTDGPYVDSIQPYFSYIPISPSQIFTSLIMTSLYRELQDVNVIVSPGLQPDVRLKVFDRWQFHVHSVILKLYSAFFRKFLDPSNRDASAGATSFSQFKYEWVTEIDDDGMGWHLVSEGSRTKELNMLDYMTGHQASVDFTASVLNKLLGALYLEPYSLTTAAELNALAELADYYCMLRVVSRTLDGVLSSSSDIIRSMRSGSGKTARLLLPAAAKLRHRPLFSDCILLSIGRWCESSHIDLRDPGFGELVTVVRNRIAFKVSKALGNIISLSLTSQDEDEEEGSLIMEVAKDLINCNYNTQVPGSSEVCLPQYIKAVSQLRYRAPHRFMFRAACFEVLLNKLYISPNVDFHFTCDGISEGFLCDTVKDEELPWNVEEMDW